MSISQPFTRYVETGRIAKATSGPLRGKLVSIVDVINQTRVSISTRTPVFARLNKPASIPPTRGMVHVCGSNSHVMNHYIIGNAD